LLACARARQFDELRYGTRAERSSISSVVVPADGISAANVGSGNFGTSPLFFRQLSDKPLLVRIGVSDAQHNSELRR
jgi:hypothetical protein